MSYDGTFQIGLSEVSSKIYERDKNGEQSVPIEMVKDWE